MLSINVLAVVTVPGLQNNRTRQQANRMQDTVRTVKGDTKTGNAVKAQPVIVAEEDTIPDSLLNARWKVQRPFPITYGDLDRKMADLDWPENMKQEAVYNDTLDTYFIGSKLGGGYLSAPIMMSPEEYRKWSEKREFDRFFRSKNDEIVKEKGKEKFSFTDMHFDLGPAEKIFGPGGVRIKTQGTAELRIGATLKNIENPSLPIRNRKTVSNTHLTLPTPSRV